MKHVDLNLLHDYDVKSVTVDHETATIEIRCKPPNGLPNGGGKTLVFREVLSHLFDDTVMGCIILGVDELTLPQFQERYADELERHANYYWPWAPQAPPPAGANSLADNYRVWELSSSYGMSGCIIAKAVEVVDTGS